MANPPGSLCHTPTASSTTSTLAKIPSLWLNLLAPIYTSIWHSPVLFALTYSNLAMNTSWNPWHPFQSQIDFDFTYYHFIEIQSSEGDINYAPYKQFDSDGKQIHSNLMSASWAWKQVDIIVDDISTHGTMFVPVIAGSDKTTVSIAMGHQEYYPMYMSPGNLSNIAWRAHGNALLPIAFLPIPKMAKKYRNTPTFQTFCRQMYHASLTTIFEPLKSGMTIPEIVKCPDGHFYRAIYGLRPYITDYPEQVCNAPPHDLNCDGTCTRSKIKMEFLIETWEPGTLWTDFGVHADIVLLTPDLLHQVIKGTFKNHLIMWINEYIIEEHGTHKAMSLLQTLIINFQQWTGNDSKALIKVYVAAISGHVPDGMVKCLSAFLDFCYIARCNAITRNGLSQLRLALAWFHLHRDIFVGTAGHYVRSICLFGSPNGLCSSITELKHIKVVKEPWRRSNRFRALAQMLRTNCRLDKLLATHQVFTRLGIMDGTTLSYQAMLLRGEQPEPRMQTPMLSDNNMDNDDYGPVPGPKSLSSTELAHTTARGYPCSLEPLAIHIHQTHFPDALQRFLYDLVHPDDDISSADINIEDCPNFTGHIFVYHSAIARFFAPSDLYLDPMYGMTIGRALLFFSFTFRDKYLPCALVHWLVPGNVPDEITGMWVMQPEFMGNGCHSLSVIHLDSVARAAHLLPIYGTSFIPEDLQFYDSLDIFHAYFVNNFLT
ncbi:hypothetical protein BGW80DRAFT_1438604 [Lactifluus volemus]|nr:hypothetical protein BGW80DRAFT_1438604 [Lactifluus volemus]